MVSKNTRRQRREEREHKSSFIYIINTQISKYYQIYYKNNIIVKTIIKCIALIISILGVYYIGKLFLIIILIFGIFLNLGQSERGCYSSYSVFNKGVRSVLGSLTANEIDNELRHTQGDNTTQFVMPMNLTGGMSSKDSNKPCVCGSNVKFKKCCGAMKAGGVSDDD
eukprot:GHVR01043547.1.p1 GENE.GHVR01043547.1~~GHVR01043547.1.p1  ORF type:complete len:167 (-),score=35.72 GHVR01043547.1:232-732(-)